MFGINKSGTKHKIGIAIPASYPASRTSYSNSVSGLVATNVQSAIDELSQSGGGINYSTTENIIGTWVDGDPVYEKTVVLQNTIEVSSSTWTQSGTYLTDVENILECHGTGSDGSYQGSILAYTDSTDGQIYLLASRNSSAWVSYFTIRYTKTTD